MIIKQSPAFHTISVRKEAYADFDETRQAWVKKYGAPISMAQLIEIAMSAYRKML